MKAPMRLPARKRLRTDLASEEGSVLLEFALSFSFWCLCAYGIIWGSLLLYADHYAALAAKEGARYAVVHGSNQTGGSCSAYTSSNCIASAAEIASYVQSTVPAALNANNLSINVTWPGTTTGGVICDTNGGANSPNCAVNVQVTYLFGLPLPLVPQGGISLNSSSSMTILE
jgi:Flp pilus assembly protein TadG